MQRRAKITRSSGSVTRATMYAYIGFVMCCFVGSAVAYYPQREAPYNTGPNEPYVFNQNLPQEPSQRLFWGSQGSNQVGGTGLWATLTNKFPFLDKMFGRMQLPTQYGAPNQYDVAAQYNTPNQYALSTQYGVPDRIQAQYQPQFQPQYQPQQYQNPQFYQQTPQQLGQRFLPFGRDVGLTDDAVIVTPPFVPPVQQPVPAPAPVPVPVAPAPSAEPVGYQYNKPQYRLELPQK